MDVIVRANPEPFREEAEDMCEALMELMKDKFEEKFEEFGLQDYVIDFIDKRE